MVPDLNLTKSNRLTSVYEAGAPAVLRDHVAVARGSFGTVRRPHDVFMVWKQAALITVALSSAPLVLWGQAGDTQSLANRRYTAAGDGLQSWTWPAFFGNALFGLRYSR